MLHVATATDDLEEAARILDQSVPAAMSETTFGLLYLHTLGRYHLATDRTRAGLDDFLACGSLMSEWSIDLPALVPWRAEAARAWLEPRDRAPNRFGAFVGFDHCTTKGGA
jgi:hypothetical protein